MNPDLTAEQRKRYTRQILLDDIGEKGQEKILDARVLVIGLGGLGSPVSLYLAAAGVGTLGIADGDKVDITNLQRQIIHFNQDLNVQKVASAKVKLQAINPALRVKEYPVFLDRATLTQLAGEFDVVVDATDHLDAKLFINESCVKAGKPLIHGGIYQYSGELMTILPGQTACYACAYRNLRPDALPSPAPVAGPLGPVAGAVGSLQAVECLKIIAGVGELVTDQMLLIDTRSMEFRKMKVSRKRDCPVCG
ncbi:MAG: HesA/MoeB/ThiF family protein [Fibrobacterota bacterium]